MNKMVTPSAQNILIAGLPYSPNVGDGVIADCLAHIIRDEFPGNAISHLDLSGRESVGAVTVPRRDLALKLLERLPARLRRVLIGAVLRRLLERKRGAWRERIAKADLVLFGGGQIFSDVDLNFPRKIAAAATLCKDTGTPVSIIAAGVAHNWSRQGRALFMTLHRAGLRDVSLRDQGSIANWVAQVGPDDPVDVQIGRDPGLLAHECYGPFAKRDGNAPIGLNITAPEVIGLHSDGGDKARPDLVETYRDICVRLVESGRRVRLFCNGATEDMRLVEALAEAAPIAPLVASGCVEIAARPLCGRDLAAIIAGCSVIVAHRLHACIVAYSYGVPPVGLAWDGKLQAFFASVQLEDNFLPSDVDAARVVAKALALHNCKIDAATHESVLEECRIQVRWHVGSSLQKDAGACA